MDNANLTREITVESVWNAVKWISLLKVSGPDGMHTIFYQKY